jgi:hypothetical protein
MSYYEIYNDRVFDLFKRPKAYSERIAIAG